MPKKKKHSPKRPYRSLIESLAKVWAIQPVEQSEAVLTFGGEEASSQLGTTIRVAVWNICKGAGSSSFMRDFNHLLQDSDVFLVQEALLSSAALHAFQSPSFVAVHGASYRRSDGLRDGVLTLARSQVASPAARILCKFPEPVLKTPKTALVTEFCCGDTGEKLTIVNIHATLLRTHRGLLDELKHLFQHLPPSGPMVLAGDFNTITPRFTNVLRDFLSQHGLDMVIMEPDHRTMLASLDHIFTREVEVVSSAVRTDITSSDHFPLIMTLKPKT